MSMQNKFLLAFILLFATSSLSASPYNLRPYKVIAGTTLGAALGVYGAYREEKTGAPTQADIDALNRDDIFYPDRVLMQGWNRQAQVVSDVFLAASPLAVVPIGIVKRRDILTLGSMYLQGFSLTLGGTNLSKGIFERYRPFAYDENAPAEKKLNIDVTRSFISGHTSMATYNFVAAAKVFSDYYPQSRYVPYVWAGAVAGSVATGAFRMAGGKHFFSDVVSGLLWGGFVGYWVPESHKKKTITFDVFPVANKEYRGLHMYFPI